MVASSLVAVLAVMVCVVVQVCPWIQENGLIVFVPHCALACGIPSPILILIYPNIKLSLFQFLAHFGLANL